MAANTVTISLHFKKSFTSVALLTGYHLCGVGVAGILIVPTARVWGKRHLFLLGNVLMVISCGWAGGSANNYTSLVWARIFQGVALAPFEALVNACVGDLYYVHVRLNKPPMIQCLSLTSIVGAWEKDGTIECCSLWSGFSYTGSGRQNYSFTWLGVDILPSGHLLSGVTAFNFLLGPRDSF